MYMDNSKELKNVFDYIQNQTFTISYQDCICETHTKINE